MKESLSLSPTPVAENCCQVGSEDYSTNARKECRAFIRQLIRQFPNSEGMLRITSNPHDFGNYLDVEIRYDEDSEDQMNLAYEMESNLPEYWDDIAINDDGMVSIKGE